MPVWVYLDLLRKPYNRLCVHTEVKSQTAVFTRPIYTHNFFHSGLESEFFMQN